MRRLGCFALVAGLLLIAGAFWFGYGWKGAGPLAKPANVEIAEGSSLAAAARTLEAAGVIGSAHRFRWQARVFGSGAAIKAGEYAFPAHASASQVLAILQGGKALQRLVVIPEGLPSVMVRDALLKA
ncbi:endolytic transglycosylase MltG, partial [Sphingomonas endophytica]